MSIIRGWWRFAIISVALFGLEIPTSLRAQSSQDLTFEVFPAQNEVPLGKPVYLKFRLRNKGNANVLVNRRFYLNDIVSLGITGPMGKVLSWCGHIYQIEVSQGDFVFLTPGAHVDRVEEVSCNVNKTAGYTFPRLGRYVIRAQYQLPFPKEVLARAAQGAVVVKGPLLAKPIPIMIVAPK